MITISNKKRAFISGFRRFVARKKSQCKLIGNRLVIPHDTIPSNVGHNYLKLWDYDKKNEKVYASVKGGRSCRIEQPF